MTSRCIRCGKEFSADIINYSVCCPYCQYVRKLTKVKCMRCEMVFGVVNKCHAICSNCGHQHSCSEIEVVE